MRCARLYSMTRQRMLDPLDDGISSVEIIDHMGTDLTVVNAARVSYNKVAKWQYDEYLNHSLKPQDERLIKYLAGHGHWTPFAQPQIQIRYKMPLFIARQWYTHKEGFTRNEISARYVTVEKEFFIPKTWRKQSEDSKQGSAGDFEDSDNGVFSMWAQNVVDAAIEAYTEMIHEGMAGEMARMILPQNTYTSFVETGSLAGYARICKLRVSPDAQQETRRYAEAVSELLSPLFPVAWSALTSS